MRGKGLYAKTVAVIFKNSSFESYSAQTSIQNPTNNTKEIYKLVVKTFEANYKDDPIRLIVVRLANLTSNNDRQLSLFEEETKEDEIQTTIDTINKKFGKAIISSASLKKIEKNNSRHYYFGNVFFLKIEKTAKNQQKKLAFITLLCYN